MGVAERCYGEMIDMFARGGGTGTVLAFRPSAEAQARVLHLLAHSKAGTLADDEQVELLGAGSVGERERLERLHPAACRRNSSTMPWLTMSRTTTLSSGSIENSTWSRSP